MIGDADASAPRWSDISRLAAVVSFLLIAGAPFAFWLGVQLTAIETAVAQVQADVSEIKVSVRAHAALPAHPIAAERIRHLRAEIAQSKAKK